MVGVVIGVYHDELVAAFDLEPRSNVELRAWKRVEGGRVRFTGARSRTWAHLIGSPNPGWSFSRRDVARSVQAIPLEVLSGGGEPVEEEGAGQP